MDEDSKLAMNMTFMEITGCSELDQAAMYVQMSNYNIEQAISLFFDNPGLVPGSGGGDSPSAQPMSGLDADEMLARQMQEEMDAELAREAVRDADNTYNEALYGGQVDRREIDAMREAPQFQGFSSINEQDDKRGLVSLFAPPNYRFEGNLDDAKQFAVSEEKLLVISFNDPSDFRAHILNRDVWKKTEVEVMMKAFFVLLQVEFTPGTGMTATYSITDSPQIIVVDPRTGRKIQTISFEDFRTEALALETLCTFMENHPMEKFYRPPPPIAQPAPTPVAAQAPPAPAAVIAEETPSPLPSPKAPTPSSNSPTTTEQKPVDSETANKVEQAHSSANNALAALAAERRARAEAAAKRRAEQQ